MKYFYLALLCLFSCNLLEAQPVNDFVANYSGEATFVGDVLTIESSGYLKMPANFTYPYNYPFDPNFNPNLPRQRKDYEYFIWVVPDEVKQIIINANTLVNAAFHYTHDLTIMGQSRATSIIYGTQIRGWNDCALVKIPNYNSDDYWMSAIHKTGGNDDSVIRDLTILNPKMYCVLGLNSIGKLDIYNCNFIDKRGGSISNSDGIDVGPNSLVKNCYFECGDDNVKINSINMRVEDCTFNMIDNAAPFQLGYGSYTNGNYMNAFNIKVIGNSGHVCNGYPVIIEDTRQSLGGWIKKANLYNSVYSGQDHWNNCNYLNENNSLILCKDDFNETTPGTLVSCSAIEYTGSTVDSYEIPDCAKDYICQNEGNHAYALLTSFIGTPAGNGIIDYSCSCTPGWQNYSQYCEDDCGSCGYSDDFCGGAIGVNYVPTGGSCNSTCQSDLNITTTYNSGSNEDFEVSNSITASNIVNNGAIVDYDAGYEIDLVDGFHAKYGCDFEAFIDGCGNARKLGGSDNNPISDNSSTMLKTATTTFIPSEVTLSNNPNPFSDITTIEYSLPNAQEVSLTISDMSGKVIQQLKKNELQDMGKHEVQFDARDLLSGLYLCTLQTDLTMQILKITLLK